MIPKLTVFTPTYNRSDKLVNLYQSLKNQTSKEFVWLVVDDGSKDGTGKIVEKMKSDADFEINYLYQENSGKHVAHNKGVMLCTTDYFFCVDSDDTLIDTAVEDILTFIHSEKELSDEQIAGIIAWKGFRETEKIGKRPMSFAPATLGELYKNYGMTGDTALIFKTNVIRLFPFPVIHGETFMRESLAYNKIDLRYKYLIFDKIIYLADYYEDGLSKNAPRLEQRNPKGAAMFRFDEYKYAVRYQDKLRNLIAYVYFNGLANNNKESRKRLGMKYYPLKLLSLMGYLRYKGL